MSVCKFDRASDSFTQSSRNAFREKKGTCPRLFFDSEYDLDFRIDCGDVLNGRLVAEKHLCLVLRLRI